MNWKRLGVCAWHGVSAMILGAATAVGTYQQAPVGWEWMILVVGLAAMFIRGVKSYLQEPE